MARRLCQHAVLVFLSALALLIFPTHASAQSCTGAIGDFVWFDANQNGLRDPAEAQNGINGVVVELRDSNGVLVGTQTTGAAVGSIPGTYGFQFLCAGTYTVTLVSGVPAGYVPTVSPPGADPARDSSTSPATVTLLPGPTGAGQKDPTVDFGFVTGCSGSIGDRVWNDVNANGVQDAGEAGMSGVGLHLFLSGSEVGSTTTDGSGNYNFPGLCPGVYSVVVDAPAGFASSPTLGTPDTALDSDASGVVIVLGLNENNPTIDFGFYAACAGTIGDRVWFDTNRDGVQDPGELGIAGVTVELLDSGDNVIATTVTDGNGNYLFSGLCGGSYTVRVSAATLPAGLVPTPTSPPGGGTPASDSNGSPAPVTLPSGISSDLTIDFGYNAPCSGTIGDFVWNDTDADGVQDPGELGIPNVTVILRDPITDAVMAVDTTDANGAYLFEGLCGGAFVVEVDPTTLPGGMVSSPANQGSDTADSDGVNHRASVSLPADDSTDLTIDFGYYRKTLIQIVKLTNGTDNNSPTGPVVAVGSTVTWTYRVTSTGSTEPLKNVVVVDDNGTPGNPADDFSPAFTGGDTSGDGLLDVGEIWLYSASATATAGQYANWATANGTGNLSNQPALQAQDPDHYFGSSPLIDIEKYTNGQDADTPTGPVVAIGSTVTWTYVVTNTGNITLTNVAVTDNRIASASIHCNGGSNVVASLAAGASFSCTATGIAVEGQYANIGTVTGTGGGQTVSDTDPSHYLAVRTTLNLTKLTGGVVSPTQFWTFTVTGPGVNATVSVGGANNPTTFSNVNLQAGATYRVCETGVPAGWTTTWQIKRGSDPYATVPFLFANTNPSIALPASGAWYSHVFDPNYVPDPGTYVNDTRCVKFVPALGQQTAFSVDNRRPAGDARTPGYWKNWNTCTGGGQAQTAAAKGGAAAGYWLLDDVLKASSVTVGNLTLLPTDCVKAVRILDKSDTVTNVKRSSEPLHNLAAHLLAAKANIVAGAKSCASATTAITAAQALLVKYKWNGTGKYTVNSADTTLARTYATTLDNYNNNNLCF